MRKHIAVLFCLAGLFVAPACFALTTSLTANGEAVVVNWPDEEGWVIGYEQDVGDEAIIEVVRKPETVENWTQIGTVLINRTPDAPFLNLDWFMQNLAEVSRRRAQEVEFALLWQGLIDGFDTRIFVIKGRGYPDGTSETQVHFLTKGTQATYMVNWIKRVPDVDKAAIDKWVDFLKTVRIIKEAS